MSVKNDLIGAKGGSSSSFRSSPDNLRSTDTFEALIGLCSGRIRGLAPGGLKNLFVDDVPIEDGSGNTTLKDFSAVLFNGDPAILRPVTLQLGGSSGAQAINLPVNNDNTGTGTGVPGEWRYGTVPQSGVDYIDIRLVVNSLFRQDKKGVYSTTASLEVELQPSGTSAWINPMASTAAPTYNRNGIKLSTGFSLFGLEEMWDTPNTWYAPAGGFLAINGKTTQPYVKELRVAVPNAGSYANKTWQVRIRLRERDSYTLNEDQESRQITWESVAGVSMAPIGDREEWRGLAYLQINGKASDQLSGVPTITGIYDFSEVRVPPASVWDSETRTYTGATWDGATEEIKWTQCPAFQLKDLIEDDVSGISALTPGSTLNKWDTLEASKWYAQLVPNGSGGTHPRYSMNYVLDNPLSVNDLTQYVAGAVGSYAWDEGDGNWRLVVEKPENATALFTKESIVGEFNYSHTDIDSRMNDMIGVFRNEERGFEEDRVRVFDQPHIDNYGRRATSLALVGCTNRQEALRRIKIRQISSLKETRQVSFVTNRQGNMVQPFSVILVADGDLASDTTLRTTGRLVSRTDTALTVRDTVRLEVGITYKVHITVPNAAYNPNSTAQPGSVDWRKPTVTITRNITNTAGARGDVTVLQIDAALPANAPVNAQIALEAVGLATLPKQYRVLDVEPQSEELVAITAIEIYTNKWNESDNIDESEILAQRPVKIIPSPLTPTDGGMFSLRSFEAEFQTKRVLTIRWLRPASIWIDGFKVEYNLNNGPWVSLAEKTQDSYVELQQPENGGYTFRISTVDRRGGTSAPLVGVYELADTAEDYAPRQIIGPLADRPSVGAREGDKYTTNNQNPNLTYIWSNGQWYEESNFVTKADQIKYNGNATVESLKPAQAGADVTGSNTSADTGKVGGVPAATVLQNITNTLALLNTNAPVIPTGLTAISEFKLDTDGSQIVNLIATWTTTTAANGLAGYNLSIRETSSGSPIEFRLGSTATRFERVVPANTVFYLKLNAVDNNGNVSGWSNEVSVTTVRDTVAPTAPTALVVENSLGNIFLRWTNAVAADLRQVEVWEATSNSSVAATRIDVVNALSGAAGSYTRAISSGSTRYYWLKSVDTSGNTSAFSLGTVGSTPSLIGPSDFTPGLAPIPTVTVLPNPAGYTGPNVIFLQSDGKLYRYVSGAWSSAISGADLGAGSIPSLALADASLTLSKFTTMVRPIENVSVLPTTGNFAGRIVFLSTDAKLYRYNGTAWTTAVATTDLSGTVSSTQIADGAILAAKLAANAVGQAALADNVITAAKLVDGAVSTLKLADAAITAAKFGTGIRPIEQFSALPAFGNPGRVVFLTTDGKLYRDTGTAWTAAVATVDLTGTIATAQIADAAITDAKVVGLAAGKVTGQLTDAQIAGIATAKLTGQITSTQITDSSISTAKLSAGAVTAEKILAGTITADQIAANAITTAKLAAGSVTTAKLVAGAVTANEIASGSITTSKLVVAPSGSALTEDPNFADPTAWLLTAGSGGSFVNINDGKVGSTAFRTSAGQQNIRSARAVPVDTSKAYRIRMTARSLTPGNLSVTYVGIYFYNGAGALIGNDPFYVFIVSIPAAWTPYVNYVGIGTATAIPVGAVSMQIHMLASLGGGGAEFQDTLIEEMVSASIIVDGSIVANKIAAGAITADKIAANVITANQIAAGAITATQIAANTITATQIAANTITSDQIMARSIVALDIVAGAITATEIMAGTITATQIAANTITAAKIASGTITATEIAAGTITAAKIATGAITISDAGALSTGGAVSITGLGYRGDLNASIGDNLITNADVKVNLDGWVNGSFITRAVSTTIGDPASAWIRGTGNNVYFEGNNSAVVAVESNKYVYMSCWVRCSVPNMSFAMYLEQYASNGTQSARPAIVYTAVSANTWYYFSGKILTEATTSGFKPVLQAFNGGGGSFTADIALPRYSKTEVNATSGAPVGTLVGSTSAGIIESNANDPANRINNHTTTIAGGKITTGTVTALQIAADTITANQIAAGAIGASEIAANVITATQIASGTITATQIAAGTITATQIAANTITANQIVAGTITASQIAAGAITADRLAIGVKGDNLVSNPNASGGSVSGWGLAQSTGSGGTLASVSPYFETTGRTGFIVQKANTGSGAGWSTRVMPVVPGKSYVARARYGSSAASASGLYVVVFHSASAPASGYHVSDGAGTLATTIVNNGAHSTTFQNYEYVWTCPANIFFASFALYSWVNGPAQFYFTEVEFLEQISTTVIRDGAITTAKIVAGAITADRIAAASITGDRISTTTSLPGTITIGTTGVQLGVTQAQAADPGSRINAFTTQIDPGKILISGGTSLANWRNGSDTTKIEGGALAANTITANKLTIGNRGLSITGIAFAYNRTNGALDWSTGYVFFNDDNNNPTSSLVGAGSYAWGGGSYNYIYFHKDAPNVLFRGVDNWSEIMADSRNVIFCIWQGGTNFIANYGGTIVDGDRITANSIQAVHLQANSVTAAKIVAGTITADKINVLNLAAISANLGTVTAGRIQNVANTVYHELDTGRQTIIANGYRKVTGAAFGASGDLMEWWGLNSIGVGSETKNNGIFCMATDGKIYFGTAPEGTGSNQTNTNGIKANGTVSAGTYNTTIVSAPVEMSGSGKYRLALSGSGSTIDVYNGGGTAITQINAYLAGVSVFEGNVYINAESGQGDFSALNSAFANIVTVNSSGTQNFVISTTKIGGAGAANASFALTFGFEKVG